MEQERAELMNWNYPIEVATAQRFSPISNNEVIYYGGGIYNYLVPVAKRHKFSNLFFRFFYAVILASNMSLCERLTIISTPDS